MSLPESSLAFDRSPIGMYRADETGRLHYVNPAFATMLGYTVEEALALVLDRDVYVDPADRASVIERHRPTGTVDGARVKWKTRTGRELTVRIWGHVVGREVPIRFDAWVIDVTALEATALELQRQQDELERTARILELVVHQMPAIYWVVDRELKILRTGGAILEVLGYAPEKLMGATLQTIHRHEPGSADPIEYHRRALAGDTVSYDTEYRGKQLAVHVGPYRAGDGSIAGVIGTSLDVTAARQLERRLVDAQRAESLGVLAGGLAHDFNNLLVAVLGNADLALREISPGTPGRSAIENIRDAGLSAAELTDQLLAYSGRGGAGTKRVMPAQVIDELLRITAPSLPAALHVNVTVAADLAVRADPAQLRQVLLNLIANARDAIGPRAGAIAIAGRLVYQDGRADPDDVISPPAGSFVLLEVTDDGPGMDVDTRRHVFEPFFTTKPTGHGLGLAAVLGIVRAHGGGIRVRSAPGQGACFQILWPNATPTIPPRAAPQPPAAAKTVLVIDDEELVRDVVARMIEDLGYRAVTAPDGNAGLAVVERQAVDAVVVDLTMPKMSGADVIAALRARRPGLPIVLCSGFDRDGRGPIEADAYLRKPFRIDALEQTLAKLLP